MCVCVFSVCMRVCVWRVYRCMCVGVSILLYKRLAYVCMFCLAECVYVSVSLQHTCK